MDFDVLQSGYCIPFYHLPSSTDELLEFLLYCSESSKALTLHQKVKMISKEALEIVLDKEPTFYSQLFLVTKVTGG